MRKDLLLSWKYDNDARAHAARTPKCLLLAGAYHPASSGAWWRVLIVQRGGTLHEAVLAQINEGRVMPEGAEQDLLGAAMRAAEAHLVGCIMDEMRALGLVGVEAPSRA